MERKERLEILKKYLEDSSGSEYKFEEIYKKFLYEISTELICNFNENEKQYLIELKNTKSREAKNYIINKNISNFNEFVYAFCKSVKKGLEIYEN